MKSNQRLPITVIVFVALTFIPKAALANVGSTMMWFGLLHLAIGNAIVGILESVLVKTVQKLNVAIWKIVLGNYVSMFFGLYVVAPIFAIEVGNRNFWDGATSFGDYQLRGFFVGMFFAYLSTLVIEYPFFRWAIPSKEKDLKVVKATLLSNSVSYIIMTGIYFLIVLPGSKW
jgi:hypothetical protein